jgi:hypothetical protein
MPTFSPELAGLSSIQRDQLTPVQKHFRECQGDTLAMIMMMNQAIIIIGGGKTMQRICEAHQKNNWPCPLIKCLFMTHEFLSSFKIE